MAKLIIIPRFILREQELEQIEKIFDQHNIRVDTIEGTYRFLEMTTETNKTEILFKIKIPVLAKEKFTIARLVLLPMNDTKVIRAQLFVIYNKEKAYQYHEECLEPYINDNNNCLKDILVEKTAECNIN